ncbi:transcriptional regulator, MarR family [Granulicatella balaenopterae]|uniref:Transcriptional regulator, MarR family n=1 Tax=Granulicatella balaenopterae TaxID=137733 RepID=A0A1H9PDW8_9LACT|nr:MarR family transcriptional regulator [Granulicatella balaenopterae]SER46374.1 transcriptional regulator, MarR family [Granulicatella balaenopterae]
MELKEFSNMLQKMRRIEYKLSKKFEQSTGFSLTRHEILLYIATHEQVVQTEIAAHLDIDPAAVTRQLKYLEKNNYVTRKKNDENARERIVSLTDYAKETMQKCHEKHKIDDYTLPVNLTKEEVQNFMQQLNTIEEKIDY